jgi:hypothetical protein
MFFVFGSPRSGTTLLAQSLDAHQDIVVPHETDFIIPMAFVFDRIADPAIGRDMLLKLITQSRGFQASIGRYLTEQQIGRIVNSCDYTAGVILQGIYEELARSAKAKIAGDKSPNDLLFLRMLVKVNGITPDTKILHIIRDIRDVMVSLHAVQWVADLDLYFPRFWANSNLYLHSLYGANKSQYWLVRYEDLVSQPEASFRQICEFLGVEYQATMLDHQRRNPFYRELGCHRHLFEPITTSRIGVHRQSLSPETRQWYERQAGEAIETFGYK